VTNVKVIHEETPLERGSKHGSREPRLSLDREPWFSEAQTWLMSLDVSLDFARSSAGFHGSLLSENIATVSLGFPTNSAAFPPPKGEARKEEKNLNIKTTVPEDGRGPAHRRHRQNEACRRGSAAPVSSRSTKGTNR
jgi:hypothetical protein